MTASRLFHGDARDLGTRVPPGSVALAYLDPPFAVGAHFSARTSQKARAQGPVAYADVWPSFDAYLSWLRERLSAVWPLLSERGTLWLHLDQRAIHEAKVLCDELFGRNAFQGEVIWVPGNGAKRRKGPGMSHQTIVIYAKSDDFTWNAKDPEMRAPFAATSLSMHFKRTDKDGRAFRERTIRGKTYTYYADEGRGVGSVWTDCPAMIANTPLRDEATGYPTQKPEKLLSRIIRASTNPGDTVLDPFSGSGTTLACAAALDRTFIGSDIGALSIRTIKKRLALRKVVFEFETLKVTSTRVRGEVASSASRRGAPEDSRTDPAAAKKKPTPSRSTEKRATSLPKR